MKKSLCYILVACFTITLFTGCSSPDEKATKLFVEASELLKSAQTAEDTSYASALELYQKALFKVDRITAKYPSSQVAVDIAQGKAQIQDYSVKTLRETIIPMAIEKAEAEQDPLACALLVAETILHAGSKATVLCAIAGSYIEAGEKDKALDILSKAILLAESMSDDWFIDDKVRVLCQIGGKYAIIAETNRTLEVLSQAVSASTRIEDANKKAWALCRVALEYAKADKINTASQILSKAIQISKSDEYAGYRAMSQCEKVRKYAQKGQYDQAFLAAKSITDADGEAIALCEIAGEYSKAGEKSLALETVSQALIVGKTIEDEILKAPALRYIACKYVEAGDKDNAFNVLSQALEMTETTDPAELKVMALCDKADKYAQSGLYDDALNLAREVGYPPTRCLVLQKIGDRHIKSEHSLSDNAKKILHEFIKEVEGESPPSLERWMEMLREIIGDSE